MRAIILFFLLIPTILFANKKQFLDSLTTELQKAKQDTNKVKILNDLSFNYFTVNPELGLEYGKKAYDLSKELGWKWGEGDALHCIGVNYFITANYPLALDYFLQSLKIKEDIGNILGASRTLTNIGSIYGFLGDQDKALEYYLKTYALKRKLNDEVGISKALNNIASVYLNKAEYDTSLEYFEKSLKLKEKFGDEIGIAGTYQNIGTLMRQKGEFIKAHEFLSKSLSIFERYNHIAGMGKVHGNIGIFYSAITDDSIISKYGEIYDHFNKSKKYYINKAIWHLSKAIEYTKKIGLIDDQQSYLGALSLLYEENGNTEKAFKLFKEHVKLKDSVFSQEKRNTIALLEAKRQNEVKQKEIEILKKDNAYSKNLSYYLIAVIGLFLILIISLFIFYRNHKTHNKNLEEKNKQINNANIELETLNRDLADKNHALSKSESQLKEASATKDRFFSIIAHDLKNPLGTFRDMTKLMVEDYDSFTSEERMEFLTLMSHSSVQLYELLENLLNWSRSQTGRLEFNPVEVDLLRLIDGNIHLLSNTAASKNISLISKADRDLIAKVDVNMITTVIRNLASNAIKFTPEGGKIVIGGLRENGFIKIFVEDNGVGIQKENIDKLFRIDEYHSTLGTSNEKGTGLGLLLCKEFVEKNGGEIEVDSIAGKGTTFYFRVPVSE